jgi:hypothetical protein
MNLKKEFNQAFEVVSKGTPTTRKTASGKLQQRQEVLLRDPLAASNEGHHSVLFFDAGIKYLEAVNCGDIISLDFVLHAGISTTGMHHTNIVPTKVVKK